MSPPLIINDHPVPEPVLTAFLATIDAATDRDMVTLAKLHRPALLHGFRPTPAAATGLRARLKSLIAGASSLESDMAALLADCGLQSRLVAVLSTKAIDAGLDDFAAYFGEATFVAALLLDSRPDVRALAHKRTEGWKPGQELPPPSKEAGRKLAETFSPFLEQIAPLLNSGDGAKASREKPAESANQELRKRLQEQETNAARSAKGEREAKEKLVKAQGDIESLTKDRDACKSRLREEARTRASLEEKLVTLEASLATRISEGVAGELDAVLRPWLARVRSLDDAPATDRQDIVETAARALVEQEALDLSWGNRARLKGRLEECNRLLAEVREARIASVRPLPRLGDIETALVEEADAISRKLDLPRIDLDPSPALLARINAAESHDEIADIRRFVVQGTDLCAITKEQAEELHARLFDRESALYDAERIEGHLPRVTPTNPLFRLRAARDRDESILLAIDGHNAMFALADLMGDSFEDGAPGKKARARLTAMAQALAGRLRGVSFRLYFDGEHAHDEAVSESLMVIYSGGTGEQRADGRIVSDLHYYRPKDLFDAIFVVTNDGELGRQVAEAGGSVIRVEELRVMLAASKGN
jgi:hypothetical protein